MERELTIENSQRGFALITVLIIAAIGLLIGAGSLLLFRFQCEKRIDRQHEIEKYFAVRSALQVLSVTAEKNFPDQLTGPKRFVYQTDSGRNVRVIVNPAKALFPNREYRFSENIKHFYVNLLIPGLFDSFVNENSIDGARYRFCTNLAMKEKNIKYDLNYLSLMHGSEVANSNGIPRCWLKIDMSPTGRWSDDLFGRRYMFNLHEQCKLINESDDSSVITNDTYRLILKRLRCDEEYPNYIHDGEWRPVDKSEEPEAVIYAELTSRQTYTNGSYRTEARFAAYTQVSNSIPEIVRDDRGNPLGKISDTLFTTNNPSSDSQSNHARNSYGIQLVGRRLSLYQASTPVSGGLIRYDLWDNGIIPEDVYYYFTNNNSTVYSTNMVMVFEVEASLSRNGTNYVHTLESDAQANEYNEYDRVANFEVYPAYEFSIDVDYPYGYTNSATFVHLDYLGNDRVDSRSAITYDAHGTLNKGWRTDEKDWREYNEWLRGRPNTEANRLQWQHERGKFKWR